MDELIKEIAESSGADPELLKKLIEYERPKVHLERRRGARDELRRMIERHLEVEER